MWNVIKLVTSPTADVRTRLLAASNLGGLSFFCCVTFSVTTLCYFEIVSTLWEEGSSQRTKNYLAIIYIFIQTVGNFYLALTTDSSVAVLPRKVVRHHEKRREKRLKGEKENGKHHQLQQKSEEAKSPKTSEKLTNSKPSPCGCASAPTSVPENNKELARGAEDYDQEQLSVNCAKRATHANPEWHFCQLCAAAVPPRSHHCLLCGTCVLRRDHHCFFMCTCIGYTNQRYFIVFCAFMAIGGIYAVILMAMYLHKKFKIVFNALSFSLLLVDGMVALFKHGPEAVPMFIVIMLFYLSLAAALIAAGFGYWQLAITLFGQTTHEAVRGSSTFSKSCWENYKIVFGRAWFVCWFLPLPVTYLPEEYNTIGLATRRQRKPSEVHRQAESSEEERSNKRVRKPKRKYKKS